MEEIATNAFVLRARNYGESDRIVVLHSPDAPGYIDVREGTADGPQLAAAMRAHGYDIRAIRPPTVPDGTARLRLALTLHANEDEIATMIGRLAQEMTRIES